MIKNIYKCIFFMYIMEILKMVDATQAKPGTNVLIEEEPYTVKKNDVSKTGKHGHAKCRIEAVGVFSNNKKVLVVPGHEKFKVPLLNKAKAQVLSKGGGKVSLMDLESFETFDVEVADEEILSTINEGDSVEYWKIGDTKMVKRKL